MSPMVTLRSRFTKPESRHYFWSIALSFLSTYSLLIYNNPVFTSMKRVGRTLTNDMGQILPNFALPLLVILLAYCFIQTLDKLKLSKSALALGTIFSVFTITGLSFSTYSDGRLWTRYLLPPPHSTVSILGYSTLSAVIGFTAIYYVILSQIFNFLDTPRATSSTKQDHRNIPSEPRSFEGRLKSLIKVHPFIFAAVTIAICWIPYFVVFYPGAFMGDGYLQLNQFFGYLPKTTHHPYLATLIMGSVFSIGKPLGLNIAMFIYTSIQGILCCLALSFTLSKTFGLIIESRFSRYSYRIFGVLLGFFALFPIFPMSMGILYKDNPYIISVVTFITAIIGITVKKNLDLKSFIIFLISGVGVLAFRGDGILIFIVGVACAAISAPIARPRIIIGGFALVLSLITLNSAVFPSIGVTKFSNTEMLSIPLQQTGRYLRDHMENVTTQERETLQSLLKDGYSLEDVASEYQPDVSDNVKNKFKTFTRSSFLKYIGIWFEMFTKYPSTYIAATLRGTYQYYYPFRTSQQVPIYYLARSHTVKNYWRNYDNQKYPGVTLIGHIQYPQQFGGIRSRIIHIVQNSYSLPVLTMFYNSGIYAWLFFILIADILRKKKWKVLITLAPIICIYLVCIISPVNGSMRYALPWIASLPILTAFWLHQNSKESDTAEGPSEGQKMNHLRKIQLKYFSITRNA